MPSRSPMMVSISLPPLSVSPHLVKVQVKARKVTVTGPKGSITKDFSHLSLDIRVMKVTTGKKRGLSVRIQMWNGFAKQACAVSTIKSLISNMITGVTEVSRSFCRCGAPRPLVRVWSARACF